MTVGTNTPTVRRKTRWPRLLAVAAIVLAALGALLVAPLELGPSHIVTAIDIARPGALVFAYVTTPGHWPEWHPSSLAVYGSVGHPLLVGESVREDFLVAGRRGRVTWRVSTCEPGRTWRIAGEIDGRPAGIVTYRLTPQAAGTHFVREFDYESPNLLFGMLNVLTLRSRIEAESQQAVARLKARLESASS